MATVDKAFRVKNGLIVEGSSATVNGSTVLTEASTEFLQDTTAAMFDGAQSGIAFEYNDTTGKITATVSTDPLFGDKITFEGTTPDAYELILQVVDPVADVTVTLPNATDTLVGKATTDTFTNKTISGTSNTLTDIGNGSLTNSSVTVNGTSISLGGSQTITAVNPNALTIGAGLSGTSYDGSSAVTVAIDSTVATTSGTQTLTNKTISGTSNTITNIANSSLDNSAITINGTSTSLGGTRTLVTDDIAEDGSPTNLWFTDERAQDAVAAAIAAGTQTNITITYDDNAGSLSFNASGGVSSLTGTANEIEVSASTGAVTIGLPSDITIAGNITIDGTPTDAKHAATKGYVDNAVSGLDWHTAANLLATSNIALTGSSGTLVIDGHTALDSSDAGYRILLKGQTTSSQNGIYTYSDNGTNYTLARSADADTYQELIGAAIFILEGTLYASTAWVQSNHYLTDFSGQTWSQFSGSGTYVNGNGLTLTGNSFAIDTTVTADVNSVQTLTNKTLTSPVLTTPSISGMLILDNNIVIEGTDDTHETTLTFTDPTQDNTITFKDASGTIAFTSDVESAVDGFGNAVTGSTGITASYASTSNILTITNVGVTSLSGTTDQITASASTGSVTLSLPQSIASTSSPTFAGLSVGSGSLTAGSVTLTDALLGTATTSVTTTSATVIDTWSATTYSTAKYIVQMKNGNDIEVLEVLVTVDANNNVYITEYADVISNAQLGTTDADYTAGNVRLLVTSTSGTTVKVHKTLIEA
jgi:hypothetical protein